ncbi:hypothetical protein [uncultured Roseibium sp.]|uniref:hypothetical protein n=1 Tax=uncultured Roseibium sp. TaxID=1936171 RepID=UPI00261302FE|nr:hypothetical protein [uncultured Roseibium sp.]
MADHKEGKKLRSRGAGKPLRSRGFLSHSGAQSTGADIGEGSKDEPAQRSRGMRQASVHANGKPKDLSPKATVKPYRLEEE